MLAGCDGEQSALAPRGDHAEAVHQLTVTMTAGGTLILLLVCALTAYAFLRDPDRRGWLGSRQPVVWGGIAFPLVVLTALLVWELRVLSRLNAQPDDDTLRIEVTGYQYWWRMRYRLPDGTGFETANEIVLPAHGRVELLLATADVIHSLWVPSLAGKMDMIPGRRTGSPSTAASPPACAASAPSIAACQHALMAFDVVAAAAGRSSTAWVLRQQRPAIEPRVPELAAGREAFIASGCGACHAVRGTEADGTIGPDLTHVGSRRLLAAGSFPNNAGTLAGWIADSAASQAGQRHAVLQRARRAPTLRAIAAWLASLEMSLPEPGTASARRVEELSRIWAAADAAGGVVDATSTTPISASTTSARRCSSSAGRHPGAADAASSSPCPENDFVAAAHLQPDLHHARHGDDVPLRRAGGGGVAVYLLPQMLAARDLPFPRLSAYAFWAYFFGGTGLLLQHLLRTSRRTAAGSCTRR